MATERSKQLRQNSDQDSQFPPVCKDFITVNTKKLYAQAYEDLKKEAETNGYLSIDSDIKAIGDSYSYLCDIAKIAGARPPLPGIVEQKRRMLENKKSTADYEEFIFLYNAFEGYVDDDAVFAFNKIRLNGKRKNIASALLMHLSFTEYSVSEKAICLAYDVYLDTFGGSKQLAEELFAKWETYCTSSIDSCSHTYFKLAKKCCENNPTFLEKDEIDFLNADSDEMETAALFLSQMKAIRIALSIDNIQIITRQLGNIDARDYSQYTTKLISDCIKYIHNTLNSDTVRKFTSELILRFAKSLLSANIRNPDLVFACIYEIWRMEAENQDFDSADVCGSLLREIAPYAKPLFTYGIDSSVIDLADKGNLRLAAELIGYKVSYYGLSETISILSKIDYSTECDYVRRSAHYLALSQYDIIRNSAKFKKERIDYMREFCKFLKGKEEYADIYSKAIDFIKGRDEVREKESRSSTSSNKPIKNKPEEKKVKKSKPAVFKNGEQKKAENETEHAPVYLLQMIYGFVFISLSCIDYGDLNTKMQGALTAIWILMLIAYIVITVVSICVTAKKTDMAPKGYMIFIETLLNIACFAINMMIFHVNGGIAATGAFTSVFFINLVIKILCRSI